MKFSILGTRGRVDGYMFMRSSRRPTGRHFAAAGPGLPSDRLLEVPDWMFDRVTGQSWLLRAAPVVSAAALAGLAAFPSEMAEVCGSPSASRDPGARHCVVPDNQARDVIQTTLTLIGGRPVHSPCMIYAYPRVSTDGQSVVAQVTHLKAAGCEKVFQEAASNATPGPTAFSSAR